MKGCVEFLGNFELVLTEKIKTYKLQYSAVYVSKHAYFGIFLLKLKIHYNEDFLLFVTKIVYKTMSVLKIALSPQKLSNPSFRTLKNLATCDFLSNPKQNYFTISENDLNRKAKKKLKKFSVKMSEVPSKFDEKNVVNFDTLKSICEDILQSNQSTIRLKYDHLKQLQIVEFKTDEAVKNFPNLPLAEESRQNVRDIKLAILNVLAIFGGVTPETLMTKIKFDTDEILDTQTDEYVITYLLTFTDWSGTIFVPKSCNCKVFT